MGELYRPSAQELAMNPKDLDQRVREQYREQNFDDLREVLPETLQESLEDARESVENALREQFGIPEVPPQLQAEMNYVIRAIEAQVGDKHFMAEPDEAVYEQMERVAAKALTFKEDVQDAGIQSVPERGQILWWVDQGGTLHERELNQDDQDMVFNMQIWAEQIVEFENVGQFEATLEKLQKRATTKPEAEQQPYIQREMVRAYSKFGFSKEQIGNLILLSEQGEIPEFGPEGKPQETQRLRVMKEVWDEYLGDGDKSQYVKFAVAMTGVGAVEGIGPALLGGALNDDSSGMTAAAFALGYLGINLVSGGVKRRLDVGFNKLMNEITEHQDGLYERLSQDLVFQPGERMGGEERGRIISSMRRSQSAFKDILFSVARVHLPAVATAGVGFTAMMAMDWRLGLISLASAPIAVAIARKADKRLHPIIMESYENEDKLTQEIGEQVDAHQDIVLGGMQEKMAERIEEIGKTWNRIGHERTQARADMEFQQGCALNSSVIAGLVGVGAVIREMGIGNAGDIVAAVMYSGQFNRGFSEILRVNNDLIKSVEAIVEMEEVFNGYARAEVEADQARVGASELEDYSIELSDVELEIDGEKILEGVNFKVPAGGVVQLEGRSGHGKTTLSRLMTGYYSPTEGGVRIGGEDVRNIKKTGEDSLYGHVAYLSQHPYIFDSGNLRENLAFGTNDAQDADMIQILSELGLAERFTRDGVLDLRGSIKGLSGGEKARLGLARVLLKIRSQESGGIVFLDQATEELDEETEAEVARIMLEEKKKRPNTTFVIISHRNEFIDALENPEEGEGVEIQRVKLDRGKQVEV